MARLKKVDLEQMGETYFESLEPERLGPSGEKSISALAPFSIGTCQERENMKERA
jgi:hypothetical protein